MNKLLDPFPTLSLPYLFLLLSLLPDIFGPVNRLRITRRM